MIILVNGATRTVDNQPRGVVGHLLSPASGNSVPSVTATGRMWAADNSAFSGFNSERYWRMIVEIGKGNRCNMLWITAPDKVGDAQETCNLWFEWHPQLSHLGLGGQVAFVGQDGLEDIPDQVPWHEMSCLFLGGTTAWKLSRAAEEFAAEALRRGKWVHMGRVNSIRRIKHALEIGCKSIDGRMFSAWPDRWQPWGVERIRRLKRQGVLFC